MHEINSSCENDLMDYIKSKNPSTPIKAYLKGNINVNTDIPDEIDYLELKDGVILFGDYCNISNFIEEKDIKFAKIECERTNSKLATIGFENINARIEPGAEIREGTVIGENAVIMMGAIINIGARIGNDSMIDMNAVVGSRAVVGKRVHVGAGAVISGVLEPPSATPCCIGDDAFIGANSVVLEGVTVGHNAVVAAGAVVCEDVKPYSVVAGVPARVIKTVDASTSLKTAIVEDLR